MPTGNKGEWSELYAFVKLLADGKIHGADMHLNKREDLYYMIIKILRGALQYVEKNESGMVSVVDADNNPICSVSAKKLDEYAEELYHAIAINTVPIIRDGMRDAAYDKIEQDLKISGLSDNRSDTADIRIVIHDPITQIEPLLGFSIKSYIGSAPTLFNSSKRSNLIYRIEPYLTIEEIVELNNMSSYSERILHLLATNHRLVFVEPANKTFLANLTLVDSKMPDILSQIYLLKFVDKVSRMTDVVEVLNERNPLGFPMDVQPHFYEYKIKRLLVDMALGMQAGHVWRGNFNADGGYIAVKRDGSIVCFHIYNWNEFQQYLLNSTKLDCPDSSHDRCDYGYIIDIPELGDPNASYIKLNCQIRFM